MSSAQPAQGWDQWLPSQQVYTLGAEEEFVLLDGDKTSLATDVSQMMSRFEQPLRSRLALETHDSILEVASSVHPHGAALERQLRQQRAQIAASLAPASIFPVGAGLHPLAMPGDSQLQSGARYDTIWRSVRALAVREPTTALHVQVGLAEPEIAVQALNRMRAHIPLLLALSANSPFWQGQDSGLASMRVPLFDAFPRTGLPRAFADWEDYRQTIDSLLRAQAIPEPTYVWWDARLQPRFGTLEIRVMDSQPSATHSAALAALVQSLVRLEVEEGYACPQLLRAPELLEENRFLAARDGGQASLIVSPQGHRRTVSELLSEALERCRDHARDLGSLDQLEAAGRLVETNGALAQRKAADGDPQRALDWLRQQFEA